MSSFTEPLAIEQIPGTKLWRTMRAVVYYAGHEGSAEAYVVPAGFRTDLGSVPRTLWPLLGHPAGRAAAGYVLHDWLYHCQVVSQARADWLLLEACAVLGVSWAKRQAIYLGVRAGGWSAWRRHAQRIEKEKAQCES